VDIWLGLALCGSVSYGGAIPDEGDEKPDDQEDDDEKTPMTRTMRSLR